MPIFSFTVGSLGDIVSLLQIAKTVTRALCDSKGSSEEYFDLISELDSVVRTVEAVQHELSVDGPNKLPPSTENALRLAIQGCLHLLRQIDKKISAWRRGFGIGWTFRKDVWLHLGWSLFTREELIALRCRLSREIGAMNTLLILAHGERLERFSRKQDEHASEIRKKQDQYASEIRRKQEEIKSEILRVARGMSGRGNSRRDGYVSKQPELTEGGTSMGVNVPAQREVSWPGRQVDTEIDYFPTSPSPELDTYARAGSWATWQPDPNIEYTPPPSNIPLPPQAPSDHQSPGTNA